MRLRLLISALLAVVVTISPVHAQRSSALRPVEQVWKPADTPPGGTSWALLESTQEITRTSSGITYSKPNFPAKVKALSGKRIKVSGYMLPLQNGAQQSHFVLLAYPPDCPFHLNPAPDQFMEVRVSKPVSSRDGVRTFEGTLILGGEDESGVFYNMVNAREV